MSCSQSLSPSVIAVPLSADALLEETNGRWPRRQCQPIKASPRFARRARGHVVDENCADLPTISFDAEGSDDRLGRPKGAYFHDHTTVDSAFAVEQGKIELERVDRTLSIILDDERQSAVILRRGFRRVELNMDSRVGSGNGCNTNRQ
jgi:hypothetical protein